MFLNYSFKDNIEKIIQFKILPTVQYSTTIN